MDAEIQIITGFYKRDPGSGEMYFDGKPCNPQNTLEAQKYGISTIFQELNLSPFTSEYINRIAIKTPSGQTPIKSLSGGNQQKVILSRWLATHPDLIILDATSFARRTITEIQAAGMKAGVAINPSQRVDVIEPLAGLVDYVVFMSVEPGFAGQKFLPGSMERLAELARIRKRGGYKFQILVDGGVNYDIAADSVKNGADMIVSNIYMVFNQPDGISGACARFDRELGRVNCEI